MGKNCNFANNLRKNSSKSEKRYTLLEKNRWQWSVNAGAGVQYQLLPHVNAYFEPRQQYYISGLYGVLNIRRFSARSEESSRKSTTFVLDFKDR